jgi:hypothetical protein
LELRSFYVLLFARVALPLAYRCLLALLALLSKQAKQTVCFFFTISKTSISSEKASAKIKEV